MSSSTLRLATGEDSFGQSEVEFVKAFFGLLQMGLGVFGIIALFNGRWLVVILCWAGALLVGFIGGLIVRRVEGISEGGRQVLGNISSAIHQLEQGNYTAADGLMVSPVSQFKFGGDNGLLPMALAIQSVTQAAVGKNDAARKTIADALSRLTNMPRVAAHEEAEMREAQEGIREVLTIVESGISRGSSPESIVREFLAYNSQG